MNAYEYELACARFERAIKRHVRAYALAQRIIAAADAEYDAADAHLAKHESFRGIPLPQCRPTRQDVSA